MRALACLALLGAGCMDLDELSMNYGMNDGMAYGMNDGKDLGGTAADLSAISDQARGVDAPAYDAIPQSIDSQLPPDADSRGDLREADLTALTISFAGAVGYTTTGNGASAIVARDFNLDGKIDVAASNEGSDNVSVFPGDGMGSLGKPTVLSSGKGPRDIAAGDVNRDGFADLVTANVGDKSFSIFAGKGDGSFAAAQNFMKLADNPHALVLVDLDHQAALDFAFTQYVNGRTASILNTSSGAMFSFGATSENVGINEAKDLVAADFTGDGFDDLAVTSVGASEVVVLINNKSGVLGTSQIIPLLFVPRNITAADFDGDGHIDVLVSAPADGSVHLLKNKANAAMPLGAPMMIANGLGMPTALAAADFDGDKIGDLAVLDATNSLVVILQGTGNGAVKSVAFAMMPAGGMGPTDVAAARLNADGLPDLVVSHSNNNVYVLLNTTH